MKKFLRITFVLLLGLTYLQPAAQESDITNIIDADFSIFTYGSPEEPVEFDSFKGYFNTYFPSWSSINVAQAGGSLLIRDGGNVRTKNVDMSAYGGCVRVSLRVKAMDTYGGTVQIALGYSSTQTIMLSGEDWEDIEVTMLGGTSYSNITVRPFLSSSGILVQYLKIDQSPSFIAAPYVFQPSDADGTSFTAMWRSVSGATEYFIDVYSYDGNGGKNYFLKNESSGTSTSKIITGLDPTKKYYFVVRASNGKGVSADSDEIEVVKAIDEMEKPVIIKNIYKDDSYEIAWSPVNDAERYEVNIYSTTTLTETGRTSILAEDFSLVTSGSFNNVDFTVYDLNRFTHQPGWDGNTTSLCLANGMMVIDNWGDERYLATPNLDLSSNNGKVFVSVNAAYSSYGSYYLNGTLNIALVTGQSGNYQVIDQKDITFDASKFKTYTVELSGGTSNCRVLFTSPESNNHRIFFEDINVEQELGAGSSIKEHIHTGNTEGNSYNGYLPSKANTTYSFTVTAIGRSASTGDIVTIKSEPSTEVQLGASQSGTDDIVGNDSGINVWASAEGLTITADKDTTVYVYDIYGRTIHTSEVKAGTSDIAINTKGIVIVKANGYTKKIIL